MNLKAVAVSVLVGAVIALLVIGIIQRGESSEAREAAQSATDSVATLSVVLDSVRAVSEAQATRVAIVEDSLAEERARMDREAAEARQEESRARADARTLRDSLRATLDSAQLHIEQEREDAQQEARRALERRLRISEEEGRALEVELREVRLWGQAGWDLAESEKALRIQEAERADAWERVANPPWTEQIVGALPEVGVGVVGAGLIACAFGALPFC